MRRALRKAEEREKTKGVENLRSYRTPVQVCPRGCAFNEVARRDQILRTGFWGRAEVTATFNFESRNCPQCGALLVKQCVRCEEDILTPVVDLCRSCGLPQPWAAERRAGADRTSIRPWRPEKKSEKKERKKKKTKSRVNDPARPLYRSREAKKGKGRKKTRGDLWIIDGDIVQLDVDAVVSNDDVDGQMWSQSARAIKKAAGEGVERLAQEGKPFPLGHAWVTTAGSLQHMRGIIHVASTSRRGVSTIETVRKCLAAALRLAAEEGYESLGVTAIGAGHAGIKLDEWLDVFAETTVDFLSGKARPKGKTAPLSVVLVLFDRSEFEEKAETLERKIHEAWVAIGEPADGKPEWKPRAVAGE